MVKLKALYMNLRIKYKLIVLITAVMLLVCLLMLIVQQYAFEKYDEELYRQSAQSLGLTAAGIEGELQKMERLSYRLATDGTLQSYLNKIKQAGTEYDRFVIADYIQTRMLEIGGMEKYVLSIQMTDYYGKEYAAGTKLVTSSPERIRMLKKESAPNKGGNTWILPDEEDRTLSSARLIRSYQELELAPLGVMTVRIDMEGLFHDYLNKAGGLENMELYILKDGHSIFPVLETGEEQELSGFIAGKQGYTTARIDGNRYFVAYVPSSNTNWTYMTLIPYDTIFERVAVVKRAVVVLLGALFVMAVILSFRFSKGITGPIERLNLKMKRVQLGHFDAWENEDDRQIPMDEAGQLHRNFRMMVQRIDDLIRENYVKQLAIKESEFQALQAQINPHFLYNTLETINWTAKMNGQRPISQMVESLGFLLRSSINIKEPLIQLKDELDIVSHYVTIQRIRFEERLDFQLDVPDEYLTTRIPKLSLQPLVENAVNYGVEQILEPCRIRIRAWHEGDQLFVVVEDTGPGMDVGMLARLKTGEVRPKGSGVGMRNIDERIKLLFGDRYGLQVNSERGAGTTITMALPYERRDEHV
ncbi:cache domain-containing sensor histidine kinase [Paenibacillus xanthanilyticus]|uniref:histidine kinase n=1 Tax=Paenibacillus xanthanilyticus TaxID=1783531 RepID=A0ABV8K4V0_9BACL